MEWSHPLKDQGSLRIGHGRGLDVGEWQGGERTCSIKADIRRAVGKGHGDENSQGRQAGLGCLELSIAEQRLY